MITARVLVNLDLKKVQERFEKGSIRPLFKAGGYISRIAKNSIKNAKDKVETVVSSDGKTRTKRVQVPSPPGKPPVTRRGKVLKRSIRFEVDKHILSVAVGPTKSSTDAFARFHEFGGRRGNAKFPARPFMGPALTASLPKLPNEFRNLL
jgi:phage gpG-like protein